MTNCANNEINELITVKEAAAILEKSPTTARTYIKKGLLDTVHKNVTKVYRHQVLAIKKMLDRADNFISPFGEVYLEKDESLKFLDNFNDPHVIGNPRRYMTRCKYGVTNKGRIINLTLNHVLTPQTVDHGYKQTKIGKMLELVHVAVASQWCPNGKFKNQVHHIDGSKDNNDALNLVLVTDDEQEEAHRLLDEARKSGEWTQYNDFIEKIKLDNQWKENIRVILDPTDGISDKYMHIWYVSEQGYADYKGGKKSWDDLFTYGDIRAECYYE